ncbi:lamin tail domain-containing protein [Microbacterium sp. NPDC057659]|uniref:lamin tail domain-containing protein n=1 Tax=Microbacterium sp. NPDC057659 TaxID=3346198 RepID=UPI003673175C
MLPTALRRAGAGALAAVVAATLCAAALPTSAVPAYAQDDPSVSEGATPAPEPSPTEPAPAPTADPTETPAPEPTQAPAPEQTAPAPAETTAPAPEQTPDAPAPAPTERAAAPVAGTDGNAGAHWPLVITEIQGDNPGADEYEYLEVTNTTDKPIDLDAAGIQVRYHTSKWNAGTVQPLIHLDGEEDAPAVIPAGGVAVFWMNYADGDPRRALTKDQFRAFYGLTDAAAPVFRFGPQGGFANSGNRGFSLTDAAGKTLSRAWVPADDGNGSTPWNAQFGVPDLIGSPDARLLDYDVTGAAAAPTPGTITVAQVTSALTKPTDPDSDGPLLQITEVAPDTANVAGSDAYEYIEVYNASDKPVDFGDYVLAYLTTDNDLTSPKALSSTLWPAGPGEPTIAAGGTLVLWIQNPAVVAAGLTVADFNTAMGSDLKLGESILTIASGGMANGGSRGLQLQTKSGHVVSRAFYFDDAQTTPTTAIQYVWNPADPATMWTPADPAGSTQAILGLAAPTPGKVTDAQVAPSFVPYPDAGTAPKIVDLTGGSEVPDSGGIELGFDITDDVLVRRVTLTLKDSLGGTEQRNLTFSAAGRYLYSIPAVDVYGKRWVEYSVTAGDGMLETTLGPVRIVLDDSPIEPVRLNVADGQYVNAQTPIVGTTDGDPGKLTTGVDGTPFGDARPSLERAPRFAIEATSTDSFFRNGLKLGDDVLKIFDEGYYDRIVTVDAEVPVDQVVRGEKLTLGVYAGTKAWPEPNLDENNDDFVMMNPRLVLPDGRVLHPTLCTGAGEGKEPVERACPADAAERIALSDANLVYILFTFDIPEDAFDSVSTLWDTTTVADGEHVVTASEGERTATRTVRVDNTAPRIDSTITDGRQYRGDFTIDAAVTDEGSGFDSVSATLDEKEITLPLKTSSLTLEPGDHVAVITAKDRVGNSSTSTIAFSTADEKPHTTLISPADGAKIDADKVDLVASPGSNVDDRLELCFAEGYRYVPTDAAVQVATGTTTDSRSSDRGDAKPLSADDLAKLTRMDGIEVAETSKTAMPYQLFTIDVPAGAKDGSDARVAWEGSANADAKVLLYVQDVKGGWQEVDRHVTTGGAPTSFTLEAQVPVAGHAKDGRITFLVQHSEGWAATDLSGRDSQVTPYNEGATPRDQYDFTLAWESDTQYYNSNEGKRAGTGGTDAWYQHQLKINRFLVDQRDDLNLQYVTHTGDIVDNQNEEHQWQNADDAYKILDDAGMPYGVLAGNHDVGHFEGNYGPYSSYFGEKRFAKNPWYGGSYKDNRGHYDLVSADGVDLLMLYMGWPDPNDTASNSEDIAWMNQVIRQYPERKVMINLHEYMLTTGGLGPFPQRIYDEVVAPNANVIAVGSGHYHDAYTRLDEFDDDGDGVADRTVTSMLFDYQALPEGGQGYLRLLHFDNEKGRIIVRTYSPSLDDFDSDEASLNSPAGMQEFEIPYAAGGIRSVAKTLSTDSFRADILTTNQIDCVKDVVSGEKTSVTWKGIGPAKGKAVARAAAAPAEHGWYVRTTGPYGGVEYSEVRTFTATGKHGGNNGGGNNGGGNNGGGNGGGNNGNGSGGKGGDAQGSGSSSSGALATTGGSTAWPIALGAGALLALAAGGILVVRGRRDRRVG